MKHATPVSNNNSPSFILQPRRLRIADAATYIASTYWFMEDMLRENQVPWQWCGKYKVVDVRDLDVWVDRDRQKQGQSQIAKAA
jgi:hypothetical protein